MDDSQQVQDELEFALLEGLDGGPARELSEEDWEALKDKVRAQHERLTSDSSPCSP